MTRTILVGISLSLVAGCGEVEQSVNPSDVSTAGTAVAVLSSAGLDDLFEEDSFSNNTTANSTANSSTVNGVTDGIRPWDLDCTARITLTGALNLTQESTGCAASSRADGVVLTWVFGSSLDKSIQIATAPEPAPATGEFTSLVAYVEKRSSVIARTRRSSPDSISLSTSRFMFSTPPSTSTLGTSSDPMDDWLASRSTVTVLPVSKLAPTRHDKIRRE